MTETRMAWMVSTNTDLTEGRGYQYPLHICNKESTALRLAKKAYVMGSDAPVSAVELINHRGKWYGPVKIIHSTEEDDNAEKILSARREAINKARAAGLTDEEIESIRRSPA